MKCSNPDCNRNIGLVAHQRGWFSKRRYCSRQCRDAFVAERFEWLCSQAIKNPQPKLMPAVVRGAEPNALLAAGGARQRGK